MLERLERRIALKRLLMKLLAKILAATAVATVCGLSLAAPTTFFGYVQTPGTAFTVVPTEAAAIAKQNFLNAVTNVGTETMDGFANGTVFPCVGYDAGGLCEDANGDPTPTVGLAFAGRSTTAAVNGGTTSPIPTAVSESSQTAAGRFDTTKGPAEPGPQMLLQTARDVTLTFNQAVSAFGFYATDVGDFGGSLSVDVVSSQGSRTFNVRSGNTSNAGENAAGNASLLFWGIAMDFGDLITSVTLRNTSNGVDAFGFDDLMVADLRPAVGGAVPAIGTPWLAALGLLAMMGLRRRQR